MSKRMAEDRLNEVLMEAFKDEIRGACEQLRDEIEAQEVEHEERRSGIAEDYSNDELEKEAVKEIQREVEGFDTFIAKCREAEKSGQPVAEIMNDNENEKALEIERLFNKKIAAKKEERREMLEEIAGDYELIEESMPELEDVNTLRELIQVNDTLCQQDFYVDFNLEEAVNKFQEKAVRELGAGFEPLVQAFVDSVLKSDPRIYEKACGMAFD